MNDSIEPPRDEPRRRRSALLDQAGLDPRQERGFNIIAGAVIAFFVLGWGVAIGNAAATGERIDLRDLTRSPLGVDASYLLSQAVEELATFRGESGELRLIILDPDETVELPTEIEDGVEVAFEPAEGGAISPTPGPGGMWRMLIRAGGETRRIPDLNVVTMVPLPRDGAGRIGDYHVGEWPADPEGGPPEGRGPEYAPPRGMIKVTQENQELYVSKHFQLRDFLTKGQEDVWPKYLILSPLLLDKLELTIQEVEAAGYPVENVGVISGFRHPHYNIHGGDPSGRGALSRHMYGDAADFFIDNTGDFRMDDLTGSGSVGRADLQIIADAAERVEERYPHLIGGIGIYMPTGAHNGMVHVDTRGERARW